MGILVKEMHCHANIIEIKEGTAAPEENKEEIIGNNTKGPPGIIDPNKVPRWIPTNPDSFPRRPDTSSRGRNDPT